MANPYMDEDELTRILAEITGDETRRADFGPESVVSAGRAAPGSPPPTVGDRELAAGLRDDSVRNLPEYEDDYIPGSAEAPAPDRPKFGPIPTEPKSPKDPGFYKTDDLAKLLEDIGGDAKPWSNDKMGAQDKDRAKSKGDRRRYYGLMAGQAVSSGMGGLSEVPHKLPDAYNEEAAVTRKAKLSDAMQTGEMKRQNPAEEREVKQLLAREKMLADAEKALAERQRKIDESNAKLEWDKNKTGIIEGGKNARTDKLIRAGLAGKIMSMYAQAGRGGEKADADYANKQATYQIPNWDQLKPNSPTDHSRGAELAGAEEAFWQVGKTLSDGLRKNGRAFPQSTEWKNVAGDYMALNQALNFLNHNGVMNFKDKDNNDVQIGNAQEFMQYVLNNGPDVLDHALDTMRKSTDARMFNLGYKRSNGDWSPKKPSNYINPSLGGGGGSNRNPIDPNVGGKFMPWIEGKGDFPPIAPPNANPGQTEQPTQKRSISYKDTLNKIRGAR